MKKLLTIIMASILAVGTLFCFTACGKDKENNSDTIVVYTEAGFAPFEYVENGQIVGVDVDIMNLVGKKLGKKIKFENVQFNTIIDAVEKGDKCDIGAAGISITNSRKQQVAFSNEYYTATLYVIYKASDASKYESMTTDGVTGVYWESMNGDKIAVQNGTTADLFLGDELAQGASCENSVKAGHSSLATALEDLNVNSNVLIIDKLPAQSLIYGKNEFKCAPLYYKGGEDENDEAAVDTYAIAVCKKQSAELLYAINEVLAELGEEGIQALVNKHLKIS